MFFGALMSCFYAMGSSFKTSLPIAIVVSFLSTAFLPKTEADPTISFLQCWISVLFYGYALAKDYSDGSYYRDNDFVEAKNTEDLASLLKSRDEDSTVADSILPTQAPLPPTIKTKTTNNKVHSSRFNAIAKRNTTSTK